MTTEQWSGSYFCRPRDDENQIQCNNQLSCVLPRSGQPIPIEYLPAEHTLDSRVRLLIKYQGRPTTTIAVGDPLDFKLETQEGKNLLQDIFATNVIARDPYSDRFVELIDGRGCPVDPYVFPALGLSR